MTGAHPDRPWARGAAGERRRHREGDEHRDDHGNQEGDGERRVERIAGQPLQHEQRYERETIAASAKPIDRPLSSNALRIAFEPEARPRRGHAAEAVVDGGRCVVNHRGQRHHEAGNHDGVECGLPPVQNKCRRHQREGDGNRADQHLAPAEQERRQAEQQENRSDDDRAEEVSSGLVEVGRRPVDPGVEFDTGEPARMLSSASSTPSVTSLVETPGNFSTTRMRPSPPSTTASPMSGWWSSTTSATSPRRSGSPPTAAPARLQAPRS